MTTPNGIEFASYIISSDFGDLVSKVCTCLMRRGRLSSQNLIRFTELSQEQVSNSLLVLIQHNCVQAFALEQLGRYGEMAKVQTHYMALFDHIIHRIRFPKFLEIVSKELDKQCTEVFEGLLQHGRLTLSQIMERSKEHQVEGNSFAHETFKERLVRLLDARFVERCPDGEPLLSLMDEDTVGRKNSSRLAKGPGAEQREVLAAAAPMDAVRFSLLEDDIFDCKENGESDSTNASVVGGKRTRDVSESRNERKTLWRPNFEIFIQHLRHKACIANVRARLDDGAANVLSSILQATKSKESEIKSTNTVPLTINDIFEEVIKTVEGRSMTLEHVRAALVQLGCATSSRTADDLYVIDLKNIIGLAQNEEVESAVLKRYGKDAYRIFRFLAKGSRLVETNKISNTVLIEKKETSSILFRLWQDDYMVMEKMTVQGSRQPVSLWKVNMDPLRRRVLDDMFHAALNLSIRSSEEAKRDSQVMEVEREKRVGEIKKRFDRALKVRFILVSSLMKLDDSIMLFHDFF